MATKIKVFSVDGSKLAKDIALKLSIDFEDPYGDLKIDSFSDSEMSPQFMETIRGKRVFLVGSTNSPTNILKMLLSVDAAMRASAKEIIAVIPYYGYGRQDRKEGPRGPIGAALMAKMLQAAGINRIMVVDFHADQIQGFFNLPVDHLSGHTLFLPQIISKLDKKLKYCICSPDAGGVKRAMAYFKKLGSYDVTFALLDKRRKKPNEIETMTLIGDVKDRHVILVDDMIDTAGTLTKAATVLSESGALSVKAVAPHGILSGKAFKNIEECKALTEIIISDSVSHESLPEKISVLPLADLLANAIKVVSKQRSLEQINS